MESFEIPIINVVGSKLKKSIFFFNNSKYDYMQLTLWPNFLRGLLWSEYVRLGECT